MANHIALTFLNLKSYSSHHESFLFIQPRLLFVESCGIIFYAGVTVFTLVWLGLVFLENQASYMDSFIRIPSLVK